MKWCCKSTSLRWEQKCWQNLSCGPVREKYWNHFLLRKFALSSSLFVCSIVCYAPKKIRCPVVDVVPFSAGNADASGQLSHDGSQSPVQVQSGKNGKTQKNHLFTRTEGSALHRTGKRLSKLLCVCLVMIFAEPLSTHRCLESIQPPESVTAKKKISVFPGTAGLAMRTNK